MTYKRGTESVMMRETLHRCTHTLLVKTNQPSQKVFVWLI